MEGGSEGWWLWRGHGSGANGGLNQIVGRLVYGGVSFSVTTIFVYSMSSGIILCLIIWLCYEMRSSVFDLNKYSLVYTYHFDISHWDYDFTYLEVFRCQILVFLCFFYVYLLVYIIWLPSQLPLLLYTRALVLFLCFPPFLLNSLPNSRRIVVTCKYIPRTCLKKFAA